MITGNVSPITLRELGNCSVPGKWKHYPVSHKDAFNRLLKCSDKFGWDVTRINCGLSKNTYSTVLAIEFTSKELADIKGCKYSFAMYNSNEQLYGWRFYGGVVTKFLGNTIGLVMSDPDVTKRHTIGTDLDEVVMVAIDSVNVQAGSYASDVRQYKRKLLTMNEAHDILIQSGMRKLCPWSRIGRAINNFAMQDSTSLWTLMRCFSHEIRRNPPLNQLKQLLGFKQLIETRSTHETQQKIA